MPGPKGLFSAFDPVREREGEVLREREVSREGEGSRDGRLAEEEPSWCEPPRPVGGLPMVKCMRSDQNLS